MLFNNSGKRHVTSIPLVGVRNRRPRLPKLPELPVCFIQGQAGQPPNAPISFGITPDKAKEGDLPSEPDMSKPSSSNITP